MMRAKYLFIVTVVLSAIIMFTSCQEEPTSVEPQDATQQGLSKFSIPEGATFVSATFNIHLWLWAGDGVRNHDINVHRITSPWEELVVTWNNFGSSFAPAVEGSFNIAALGFYSVDVTALVGNWLDGTHPNYGLLLDPVINYPRGYFNSRENSYNGTIGDAPYLDICYDINGGTVCEQIEPIGDATVWEAMPNTNLGADESLYLAMWGPSNVWLDKQPILMWDFETTPPEPDCNTAYAWGGGDVLAQCFIGLPGVNPNNWGWSNYIDDVSEDFNFEWPIYAGAGGCDRSGAAIAGTLSVDYVAADDCVTIGFTINPPYALDDFHLWVSEESLLPTRRNGRYITAPGQFNHNGDTEVCDLDEPFWIAAHFGVCN